MNESEKKFKEWLDSIYNPYVFIDQSSFTQSEDFKNKVSRPDFFIELDSKNLIAVDIKQRTLNPQFNTFKLTKTSQDRLASFELRFNIPVWIAFTTEANEMKVWHWIGINEIPTRGKTIKLKSKEFWAIGIEHCDTLEWKDDLEIITSKLPPRTELDAFQRDFLTEILKKMATNDTELKQSIRQRRIEQKKLEKRLEIVERDYMLKPSVFLQKIQKDITEKVSETVKKLKEKIDKTLNPEENDLE